MGTGILGHGWTMQGPAGVLGYGKERDTFQSNCKCKEALEMMHKYSRQAISTVLKEKKSVYRIDSR